MLRNQYNNLQTLESLEYTISLGTPYLNQSPKHNRFSMRSHADGDVLINIFLLISQ